MGFIGKLLLDFNYRIKMVSDIAQTQLMLFQNQ